jgi:hypothetical protein
MLPQVVLPSILRAVVHVRPATAPAGALLSPVCESLLVGDSVQAYLKPAFLKNVCHNHSH